MLGRVMGVPSESASFCGRGLARRGREAIKMDFGPVGRSIPYASAVGPISWTGLVQYGFAHGGFSLNRVNHFILGFRPEK